ncbi:hypothetical protein C8R46DRAFT_1219739 [Mycena filopes]|nr:hypothetical protein C8R46DRAFT_1219739 [Mycena filopes]
MSIRDYKKADAYAVNPSLVHPLLLPLHFLSFYHLFSTMRFTIAFLSLHFAASSLAAPLEGRVVCPTGNRGCSTCFATKGCSFVASYGAKLTDDCVPAAKAALSPPSAVYSTAAECKAFTTAVTQWNGIKSHVLTGDLITKVGGASSTSGRHLLSNFNNKNGATLKTQLSNIANVNADTKIMEFAIPGVGLKTLWVDQPGATSLKLTSLTGTFWSSTTVQQVCQAAIAASLIATPGQAAGTVSTFAVDNPIKPGERLCMRVVSQRTCFPDSSVATTTAARSPCTEAVDAED